MNGWENVDPDWRKRVQPNLAPMTRPKRRDHEKVSAYQKTEIVAPVSRQAAITGSSGNLSVVLRTQTLIIPDIGPSLNEYDRMHQYKRAALHKRWHSMVVREVSEQGIQVVEVYPALVSIECYFGPGRTRFDWDNLSPTAKMIQDGLVEAGVLKNDSPKYAQGDGMKSYKTDLESYTLFTIHEHDTQKP